MTQPVSVEKQIIDIDFSGGLNEDPRPEGLDWTKYLKVADNVDFGDSGAMKVRSGLYNVADEEDYNSAGNYSVNPSRLLSTGSGVLCIGTLSGVGSYYQFNEKGYQIQSTRARWSPKGRVASFSVTPRTACSVPCSGSAAPRQVGTGFTDEYDISVVSPDGTNYLVSFRDRGSENVARSYNLSVGSGNAQMCIVGRRYLHLYVGYAANCKLYQFDVQNLPDAAPSAVSMTSGSYVAGAVATSATASAVVMTNGNISKCGVTPSETGTGSVAGFSGTEIHDVASDGTSLFIIGLNATPRGLLKVVTVSSLATSRTVTDTDATLSAARFSIGVTASTSNCCILAHYSTAVTGGFTLPTTRLLHCTSGATVFTSVQVIPGYGQVSAPCYNYTTGRFYAALLDLPQAGLGAGHSASVVGGACPLVDLGNVQSTGWQTIPNGFHVEAVLDGYIDYAGGNSLTTGAYSALSQCPQKIYAGDIFSSVAYLPGYEMSIGAICKIGPNSYSSETRKLLLHDFGKYICDTDAISGGVTSLYDGIVVSEAGCLTTPAVIAVAAGTGLYIEAGVYNYVVVFETVDAKGRRIISKCSNPFSITLSSTDQVNITMTFPVVSDFFCSHTNNATNGFDYRWTLYRTSSGGTQYYKVTQGALVPASVTVAVLTTVDSTTDTDLVALPLLHRQPGTIGTPLDRYYAPASSCLVRHKDRVFVARGNDVYYSSFAVSGEQPWFNPAFSFNVPGGIGDITALGSMDGTLVVFKKNAIFVVDGDGPPENGGNGTEFSPPRKVPCEVGCVFGPSLIHTNSGLMFRSSRGIELLNRKFQIEFIGKRVFRTTDTNSIHGVGAYDPVTSRCIWLVATPSGSLSYGSTFPVGGLTGYAVVYDTVSNTWSRYKLLDSLYGYGYAMQDVCFAEVGSGPLSIATAGRFAFTDSYKLYLEHGNVDYTTAEAFIPIHLETGWVKASSKQERIRISDFIIAAYRNADCTVAVSYATDYSPSYTSVKTWTPSTTGSLTIVQLETQPPKESVQSMSFKIVTSDPTPTSFGAGSQMDIFGLSVRIGLKGGGVKLPVAQKG